MGCEPSLWANLEIPAPVGHSQAQLRHPVRCPHGRRQAGAGVFRRGVVYNCCIAAQSGSGKSFLANEIIVNYLGEGARIWVIDVGHSYQNLCETLDGDFMAFSADKPICLNPFELVRSWEEEADVVAGLVTAMAAPTEKLSDYQTAGLKRVLKSVWDAQGQSMTVDDIAKSLCAETDQRLTDVGEQLFPFRKYGGAAVTITQSVNDLYRTAVNVRLDLATL